MYTTEDAWIIVRDDSIRQTAEEIAREVAARMRDWNRLKKAARMFEEQTAYPHIAKWYPPSIAHGSGGMAVFCSYLDQCFPGEDWDALGRRHLEFACSPLRDAPAGSTSLFGGLAGLAFAAWSLARGGTRYTRLMSAIHTALLPLVVEQCRELRSASSGLFVSQFDLISGLAGVAGYLLSRKDVSEIQPVLREVLEVLVCVVGDTSPLPVWHTPAAKTLDPSMQGPDNHGNLNLGLAHGIPGPLAALALAMLSGVTVPGIQDAVMTAAKWLLDYAVQDAWGINWPSAVPLREQHGSLVPTEAASRQPTRAGWCYGAPGVARSLWLAGKATGQSDMCDCAVKAMKTVSARPVNCRHIHSPTFCHGIAGLLQIVLRFARDTKDEAFTEFAHSLLGQLIDLYEPDSVLGYRDRETGGNVTDNPGLLDGAPGVAIVMLAAVSQCSPTWDRLFLLA